MAISLDDLTYFIELTGTLNFSRAAERIGIAQPSLSAAIKRLESEIGVPLFIRIKTGVILTPAGKQLLIKAKQLLHVWDNIKNETIGSHYEVQGEFTVGCHPSVGLYALPGLLSSLLQKYPKLVVELKHDISRKILSDVINLTIDVGIVINPVRHPDLIIHKLYNDKTTFWSSPKLSLNQKLHSKQLVVICDAELAQTEWLLKQLHKMNIKNYRIVTSSSLELIAKLTAAGAGIGILPTSVAMSSLPSKLKLLPNMPMYEDEAFVIYRHENRDIKAIRTIVDAIKSQLMN